MRARITIADKSGTNDGYQGAALVILEDVDLQAVHRDRTNEVGQVTISEDDLNGIQRITAARRRRG